MLYFLSPQIRTTNPKTFTLSTSISHCFYLVLEILKPSESTNIEFRLLMGPMRLLLLGEGKDYEGRTILIRHQSLGTGYKPHSLFSGRKTGINAPSSKGRGRPVVRLYIKVFTLDFQAWEYFP